MADGRIVKISGPLIVAEGMEAAIGEMRRTPDELFDQIEAMVAAGYMESLEADDVTGSG